MNKKEARQKSNEWIKKHLLDNWTMICRQDDISNNLYKIIVRKFYTKYEYEFREYQIKYNREGK